MRTSTIAEVAATARVSERLRRTREAAPRSAPRLGASRPAVRSSPFRHHGIRRDRALRRGRLSTGTALLDRVHLHAAGMARVDRRHALALRPWPERVSGSRPTEEHHANIESSSSPWRWSSPRSATTSAVSRRGCGSRAAAAWIQLATSRRIEELKGRRSAIPRSRPWRGRGTSRHSLNKVTLLKGAANVRTTPES